MGDNRNGTSTLRGSIPHNTEATWKSDRPPGSNCLGIT